MLEKDGCAKSDEFSEKFQMAFDLPLIFGKSCCKYLLMDRTGWDGGDGMRGDGMEKNDTYQTVNRPGFKGCI